MSEGNSTGAWVVALARAGYGVALLVAPQALIKLTGDPVTGQPAGASRARPSRRACGVARVLGARHLMQAGLTAVALRAGPGRSYYALAGGAAVDALHATTMVGLALVDRGRGGWRWPTRRSSWRSRPPVASPPSGRAHRRPVEPRGQGKARAGRPTRARCAGREGPGFYFLKASLTFSPACLRLPLA